jgi:hypothetical protein
VGIEILYALQAGNVAEASRYATCAGRRRIARYFRRPNDPRVQWIRSWGHSVQGRTQGSRALCRFAELGEGTVAVLCLRLKQEGWRLDDIQQVTSDAYDEYGQLDEGPSNLLG